MDGLRFTGRHWWGNAITWQDRVEPAIGDLAEEIGKQFSRPTSTAIYRY